MGMGWAAQGLCPPACACHPCICARGSLPWGLQGRNSSNVTLALLFPAEKKMMSSASAAGTQQIYSQGSPFPPGHSGKAFRYLVGAGSGARGEEEAPLPSEALGLRAWLCMQQILQTSLRAYASTCPGQAQESGGSGSAL